MIIGGLGSDKINVLLNSIKHQRPDINKIYHVKYQFESKYQLLIKEREKVGIKQTKNPKKKKFIIHKKLMMFMKT